MNKINNENYKEYQKYISALIFIEIFNPILTFFLIIFLSNLNKLILFLDTPGYGYGVIMVLSGGVSIIFGIPALLLNWTIKDMIKKNKDIKSTFKSLCILLTPCIIHWVIIILGTVFNLL